MASINFTYKLFNITTKEVSHKYFSIEFSFKELLDIIPGRLAKRYRIVLKIPQPAGDPFRGRVS